MKNWKVNILTVKLFSVAANDLVFSGGNRLLVSVHAVHYLVNGWHNLTDLREALLQNFNFTSIMLYYYLYLDLIHLNNSSK